MLAAVPRRVVVWIGSSIALLACGDGSHPLVSDVGGAGPPAAAGGSPMVGGSSGSENDRQQEAETSDRAPNDGAGGDGIPSGDRPRGERGPFPTPPGFGGSADFGRGAPPGFGGRPPGFGGSADFGRGTGFYAPTPR